MNPLRASTRCSLFLSALILLACPICFAQRPSASGLPPDLAKFLTRAVSALKSKDSSALHALAANAQSLAWLGNQMERAEWKIAVLHLGNRGQGTGNRKDAKRAVQSKIQNLKSKIPTSEPPNAKRPLSPQSSVLSTAFLAVFHDYHDLESIGDHVHRLEKMPEGWRFGAEIPESDTRGYRVRDHRLNVRFDLPKNACRITDEVVIERTGDGKEPCLLRLSAALKVERIAREGKPFSARIVPGVIAFWPPAEKTFTLSLAYYGAINHPWDYILPSEVVMTSYWYPHIGRLPAKHTVTAAVPKGWTAIGQGELLRRADTKRESSFTYRNTVPTCFFTLDAGPYAIIRRKIGARTLTAYLLKPDKTLAKQCLDSIERALPRYETWFGKYPYTGYAVVETRGPFPGALEAYSFATYGRGSLPGAIPHELAHSWWGGIVPNTYLRTMWNESFATYSEGLLDRQAVPKPPDRALRGQHQDEDFGRSRLQAFAVPISAAPDTNVGSHNAVGYGKGSLVLAMLEDLLGTEAMLKCLRRFHDDHPPGEAADWPDFARAVQGVTGKDWGWFFDQWLNRGGVPVVKLANVKREKSAKGWQVTGEIVQEGTSYRLKLPVEIETKGAAIRAECSADRARTPFTLDVPDEPLAVKLDPNGNILMAGAHLEKEGDSPLVARFAP